METFKLINRRISYTVVAVSAVMLTIFITKLTSAALVTERSIEPSSSSVSATNVTYNVSFTAAGQANAIVLDFCSNSPLIGQSCATPAGFDVSGAEVSTEGFTQTNILRANTLRIAGPITAASAVSVSIAGVSNPSSAGPLYARIITYNNDSNADSYESESIGGGVVDSGSVAMSINPTIGVSGSVLESMTFCVAKNAITGNCDLTGNQPPALELGEAVGDSKVLSAEISEGSIHAQISTNAVSGAVVSLKSSATGCGGLMRAGAPNSCDIQPALTGGIATGQARFGVKAADGPDSGPDSSGVFRAVNNYNSSTFTLNYSIGDLAGVTGPYGDPFLDTNGAPAIGKNMLLTFGAAISQTTPAGSYSTNLNLIATGKF